MSTQKSTSRPSTTGQPVLERTSTTKSYDIVDKDYYESSDSFIRHWNRLSSNQLRVSYVSEGDKQYFQAFKRDGKAWEKKPFYKGQGNVSDPERYDHFLKELMATADRELRDKCHEHNINIRQSSCRQQ